MLEKYEVCCGLFHGFDRSAWATGSPADRLNLLPAALEHVLAQEDGKARCLKAVRELSQAFALAVPHPETVRIRDDVSLFQHVRAALSKRTGPDAKSDEGWTTRCGRSSRGPWRRTAWWTSSPRWG